VDGGRAVGRRGKMTESENVFDIKQNIPFNVLFQTYFLIHNEARV
jgi:hypothetical protein